MILARPGRWIVGRLILALLALSSASACFAVSQIDTFEFSDEVQERRYRALIDEFRCPKCYGVNKFHDHTEHTLCADTEKSV